MDRRRKQKELAGRAQLRISEDAFLEKGHADATMGANSTSYPTSLARSCDPFVDQDLTWRVADSLL
jgi:hypothetical protein